VRAGSSRKSLRRQRETDADAVVEEIVSDARRDNDRINPGCRGFYRATDVGPHIIGPDQKIMQTLNQDGSNGEPYVNHLSGHPELFLVIPIREWDDAQAVRNVGPVTRYLGQRRERTFVKANCAAIPTGLLESEMFGHEKGNWRCLRASACPGQRSPIRCESQVVHAPDGNCEQLTT